MGSYLRPAELDDALRALASSTRIIVAGGTDYYPARVGKPLDDDILDITGLAGLRGIREATDYWRIPALATWTDLIEAPLPPLFDGLKRAAREVGGVQIQNAGTIAGNLCNASPAADGAPSLLAMNALVELSSVRGERLLSVDQFVVGNRRTTRRDNEMVTAIRIPKPTGETRSTFLKLGARSYLVISIVMVGAVIEHDEEQSIVSARLAVGSCSAVARRLPELEALLRGCKLTTDIIREVRSEHLAGLSPIDDVRGTADYRREAALALIKRALRELA